MNELQEVNEQPIKRLEARGANSLSDVDILAVVLGGNKPTERTITQAREVFNKVNYNYLRFSQLNLFDFQACGLTKTQALRVIAARELSKRTESKVQPKPKKISRSSDIYDIMSGELKDLHHEEFWAVYMSRNNSVMDKVKISQGGISGTILDVRLILKGAIERHASSIICVHNHPSGNREPSDADKRVTKKLKDSASIMDIQLLDHLIICGESYYSFGDEGDI